MLTATSRSLKGSTLFRGRPSTTITALNSPILRYSSSAGETLLKNFFRADTICSPFGVRTFPLLFVSTNPPSLSVATKVFIAPPPRPRREAKFPLLVSRSSCIVSKAKTR